MTKSAPALRQKTDCSIPVELLRRASLFHGLSDAEIDDILSRGSVRDLSRDSWLFNQGEQGREFFLLVSGRIRLHQVSVQGENLLVCFVSPGVTFAGIAVMTSGVHSYSALSVRPSRVVAWPGSVGRELIQVYPRLALNMFAIAAQFLNCFQDRCRQLITKSVPRRIICAVAELARTIGESKDQGVLIDDPGMHRNVADLAGTTVYSVSRVLADLHRQGIITKRRGRIVVRDYSRLLELRDSLEP